MLEDSFKEGLNTDLFARYIPLPELMGGIIYRDVTLKHTGILTSLSNPPTSTSGWGFSNRSEGELRFNQDGYVDAGDECRLTQFTVTAWVYNRGGNSSGYVGIVTNTVDTHFYGWGLFLNISGLDIVTLLIQSSVNEYDINDSNTMSKNVWHFLTGTYDGVTGRLYIDGLEKSNLSATLEYEAGDHIVFGDITNTLNANRRFIGSLSEVCIYNRVLRPVEIQYLYNRSLYQELLVQSEFPYIFPFRDYPYIKV